MKTAENLEWRVNKNYEELVAELIENYRQLGCLMNLKLHFLKSHL